MDRRSKKKKINYFFDSVEYHEKKTWKKKETKNLLFWDLFIVFLI